MRLFCFGFLVFLGLASLGAPTPSTHTVQTGETVYAIAKKYGITTDAILQANPDLNPSRIHAGDKIRLPSAKPLTSPAAPKAPTVSSNPPVPTTAKPKEWVRVEKGDTLSKIARNEGIRVEDLRKWNRVEGHTIRPGDLLRIRAPSTNTLVSTNPATADWLRELSIDPSGIWWSLLALLAVPMTLGLTLGHRSPALAAKLRKPLGTFSLLALLAFIVAGLVRERHLLNAQILPTFGLVVLHNAAGLLLGWLSAQAFRVNARDTRAVMIEGGMQNSGLALGVIAVQFNADLGMVIVASLWGIWHIVSGMTLALIWRTRDARSGH